MNNSNSGTTGQQQHTPPPHHPQPPPPMQLPGMVSAIEHYRLSQLYQYAMAAERLRCPPGSQGVTTATAFLPPIPHPGFRPDLTPFLYGSYCRIDPRLALCRPPDEPKPQHSYIGLIAMAILGSPDKKLVLSDIYQHILDNYPYFRSRGPGWRNSIRHNLSLNDCFLKSGRSANGKGHYWAIHPANVDDFTKGDFRRRKAQRKVRRHMGLAVDDADSPSPPPVSPPPVNWPDHTHLPLFHHHHGNRHLQHPHFPLNTHALALTATNAGPSFEFANSLLTRRGGTTTAPTELLVNSTLTLSMNFNQLHKERKRQFDVASLLAPENEMNSQSELTPISPDSTGKSIKSEEDECEHFSRSPSPISSFKKMSPINSEDEGLSDEEERIILPNETHEHCIEKNSSDDEGERDGRKSTESVISINKNPRPSSSSLSPHGLPPPLPPLTTYRSPGTQCRDECLTSSSGSSRHDARVSRVIPSSTTSPMMSPLCQHIDPTLHQHQLGPPFLHPSFTHGFPFNPNQHLLQHNPSLASLMILSSRYREIASGMANVNKKSQQ